VPVTMREVAQQAGVSIKTVSRVVNNQQGEISAATRQRVSAVIDRLGYRPNVQARALVTQRTQTLGLVVVTIDNPFYSEVASSVQAAAREHQYHTFLASTENNLEDELNILESLAAQGVDGIIVCPTYLSNDNLLRFAGRFRPIVCIHNPVEHPHISQVRGDIRLGAQMAVDYLSERGHTRIGMVASTESPPERRWREHGYADGLARHGIPFEPARVRRGSSTIDGGYEVTRELLTACPELTALFAYNDLMAVGALRASQELGRRVPEDCAIVGFDDTAVAAVTTPTLTTVRVDKRELGRRAVERLLEMIDHPNQTYPSLVLPPELVVRQSA
jgi:LacI family transcriptional regulator